MSESGERPVLACDLTMIEVGQRPEHQAVAQDLLGQRIQEIVERSDGFALRFEAADYGVITRFIENERRCCPFLRFELDVAPGHGPIWLRLTGPDGAKDVLRAAIDWPVRER